MVEDSDYRFFSNPAFEFHGRITAISDRGLPYSVPEIDPAQIASGETLKWSVIDGTLCAYLEC